MRFPEHQELKLSQGHLCWRHTSSWLGLFDAQGQERTTARFGTTRLQLARLAQFSARASHSLLQSSFSPLSSHLGQNVSRRGGTKKSNGEIQRIMTEEMGIMDVKMIPEGKRIGAGSRIMDEMMMTVAMRIMEERGIVKKSGMTRNEAG